MSTKAKRESGEERRRARRTLIQESFNLFLVLPESLGMARIYMRDISRLGLSFRTEVEVGLKQGQDVKARVYLNPAFYLPLDCKVVRIHGMEFGLEFTKPDAASTQALGLLQDFIEAAEKSGVLAE